MKAVGSARDERILGRPRRLGPAGDPATEVAMAAIAAGLEEGGKAGILQRDVFHRAALAAVELDDAAATGGAGDQPVADRGAFGDAVDAEEPRPECCCRAGGTAVASAPLEQAGLLVDHVIPGPIEFRRVSGIDLHVPVFALGVRATGLDPPLREGDAGELQRSSLQNDVAAISKQHRAMAGILENDRNALGVDRGVAPAGQFDAVAARGGQRVGAPGDRQVAGTLVVSRQEGRRQCGGLRRIADGGRTV